RDHRVAGRVAFHNVERLTFGEQITVSHTVDEHGLVARNASNHLVCEDSRLESVGLLDSVILQNRVTGSSHLTLVKVVDFQNTKGSLNHLHSRLYGGGFKANIGHLIDRDSGRDFDEECCLALKGLIASRHGLEEASELGLQNVDVGKCS